MLYIFQKWDVLATVVGKVIPEKITRIYYRGYKIYEMDTEFVTAGPEYCRPYISKKPEKEIHEEIEPPADYVKVFLKMLSHPNVAFKEWIVRQYDHEVRGCTVLKPLQGRMNFETHGDAAVIKPTRSWKGLAITADVNPWMCKIDPYWGAASSFDEMVRNLVAVNARPHSFNDCLNFGNPEKPERMGEFVECVRAIGWMAKETKIPCVSGNVSFYNETPYGAVAPTPSLLGIGIVDDVRKTITTDFKGGAVVLVGETEREFGGSLYSVVMRQRCHIVPRTSPEVLKRYADTLLESFQRFRVEACHDVGMGGLAVTIAEMSFGGGRGFEAVRKLNFVELFSESNTRWVVEVDEKEAEHYIEFLNARGLKAELIGYSEGDTLNFGTFSVEVEKVDRVWREGFSRYL